MTPSTPKFLLNLLLRGKMPWGTRVKPEEQLCIQIADYLRAESITGCLRGVWGHVANEGKRHIKVACVMKAMGLIPGTPDYFFIWNGGGGVIEIKVGKGRLSPNQVDYTAWCNHENVHHAVCRSLQEVIATLVEWGALDAHAA